jgi:transposase
MEGRFLMSRRELERKRVMEQVLEGRLTLKKASELLQVSYRQAVRICNRFKSQGTKGLIHRNRGRPSNRRHPETLRKKVLKRYGRWAI